MALIPAECPTCWHKCLIDESLAGRPITCPGPRCGRSFTAPARPRPVLPEIEFGEASSELDENSHVAISEQRVEEILRKSKPKRPPNKPSRSDAIESESIDLVESSLRVAKSTTNALSFASGQGKIVIGLICVSVFFQLLSLAIQANQRVTRWEYDIQSPSDNRFESAMNELGRDGWEIVSARRATSEFGTSASYEVILKRPAR